MTQSVVRSDEIKRFRWVAFCEGVALGGGTRLRARSVNTPRALARA